MNILFVHSNIYGLSQYIENELKRQGHIVDKLEDFILPYENGFKKIGLIRKIKNLLHNYKKTSERIWEDFFRTNPKYLNNDYDLCLCTNGFSLSPYFFEKIKEKNKKIKFVLYLWDSIKFFDFERNFSFFDSIYSFDYNDSKENQNITYLPFYWMPPTVACNKPSSYYMSTVGTNHRGRLYIAEKVAQQLKKYGLTYSFHIIDSCNGSITLKLMFRLLCAYARRDYATVLEIKTHIGWKHSPLISSTFISPIEVINSISQSDSILDTDVAIQSGPTPRMIWALALGKKIVTTNQYVRQMPFYNERRIYVIDRKNPYIAPEFLESNEECNIDPYFEKLRIDNWVKQLIS